MSENNKVLNLYPIDYPFETLVQRANTNPPKLILNPEFQRKYKWDSVIHSVQARNRFLTYATN